MAMQEKRHAPVDSSSAISTSDSDHESVQDSGQDVAPVVEKVLSPAAQRALAEAEARRAASSERDAAAGRVPREINGRGGPDPVRYGDWENKGIISDF